MVHTDPETFNRWLDDFEQSFKSRESDRAVVAFGSSSRGELSPQSDLDARIIRRPGFGNGSETWAITAIFRLKALLSGFPLDIYALDGNTSLNRRWDNEDPIALVDNDNLFR